MPLISEAVKWWGVVSLISEAVIRGICGSDFRVKGREGEEELSFAMPYAPLPCTPFRLHHGLSTVQLGQSPHPCGAWGHSNSAQSMVQRHMTWCMLHGHEAWVMAYKIMVNRSNL